MNVAIFIIATGKYISFLDKLKDGIDKYFLVGHKKTIYVFTDSDTVPQGCERVHQAHEPWPAPTLFRYRYITDFHKANNIKHDYYYYLDADMEVLDVVGDEIFGDVVATIHPGFYRVKKEDMGHVRRFISRCNSPWRLMKNYYAGAVNGGKKYLEIASVISSWVDVDQKYGFTPEWHDEAYLNAYLCRNPPDVILDPSYCFPLGLGAVWGEWGIKDFKPKIGAIYKRNFEK